MDNDVVDNPAEFIRKGIANTQENWDILNATGVHWWANSETLAEMEIETNSEEDLEALLASLKQSSLPLGAKKYRTRNLNG